MIGTLAQSDAIPVLEAAVRFAGQRQRIIAHNVANMTTPDFIPTDVPPVEFQRVMRDAVGRRRAETGGMHGPLRWNETRELRKDRDGQLAISPRTPGSGLLLHDRNNRDAERLMQDLTENAAAFRVASDLLRSRYEVMRSAISERA